MGGTTAKICLIDDGAPQTARTFEVARIGRFKKGSGLPLRIPVIEMVEIGAGGGSLAHVDALGRIAVGPESAGADARAGLLRPRRDAAGGDGREPRARTLRPGALRRRHHGAGRRASRAALDRRGGRAARGRCRAGGAGVVEMVDETMANAARIHAIESGKAFADRTLIAFGGGGPVHACRVAEKIGASRMLVPPGAGVGSAIGFLRAPVGYEVVRSLYQRLGSFDAAAVNALLDDMTREAMAVVDAGRFGAPVQACGRRSCAMSARATRSRCACPTARLAADDAAHPGQLRRGIRAVLRPPGAGLGRGGDELRRRGRDRDAGA